MGGFGFDELDTVKTITNSGIAEEEKREMQRLRKSCII
jgi:hypothetical protein